METIHLKTIDPVSQDLLGFAARQGLNLNWERYEKLQPQDGFLRLGLSCPFGCMQGPCRIDPFERGADRGLCGLERDGMVAALLLRLCLQGALEAMADSAHTAENKDLTWSDAMAPMVAATLGSLGGTELSPDEIFQSAAVLQRPGATAEELVRRALRLSVLTLGLLNTRSLYRQNSGRLLCKAGYGLIAGEKAVIGVTGKIEDDIVTGLLKEAQTAAIGARLVSLGDWIPTSEAFLPMACTSGEAELLLGTGEIDLVVCGPGTPPAIPAICRNLDIPLIFSEKAPSSRKIVRLAVESQRTGSSSGILTDTSPVAEAEVLMTAGELASEMKRSSATRLALFGGWDTEQQTLGWIPTEVAPVLSKKGVLVAGWGDAGLWMVKRGLSGADNKQPVRILDVNRGPLLALETVAAGGNFDNIRGICYTGLRQCYDFALALGLAGLGVRVCIASPLPVWGSKRVVDQLAQTVALQGGALTHFDHPAGANEILQWFKK